MAFQIVFRRDFYRVPVESMMLIEALVFRGDHGMLKIRRDLVQSNEFVSFVIRLAVNPGLYVSLHVHGGRRRVDPPGGYQDQRCQRPKKSQPSEKPTNDGSERDLAKRSPALRV